MIIDLASFIETERSYWEELDAFLDRMSKDYALTLSLEEIQRFHYLYQRASADLVKVHTFCAENDLKKHLENLVSRAYSEIHGEKNTAVKFHPLHWLFHTFPRTFRTNILAFALAVCVTLIGGLFGAVAVHLDPEAKEVILPFDHLLGSPGDRVAEEESRTGDHLTSKTTFSAFLMTHNTRVTLTTMAMGIFWGLGSLILLFYNGVILGAIVFDYVAAGESLFLMGWLLPHGIIEIPAILIGGQAGFVLGHALIGWGTRRSLRQRLREKISDIVTLVFGASVMLVWAGIVEAFLSQYHYPVISYELKITIGVIEGFLLLVFLTQFGRNTAGRQQKRPKESEYAF
ncbi:MAG: hypothetical protein CR997_06715 [Acidobacteria bacterium]|nr:MAG: hypothetical protein CR997_06715 [Acidobacteriota bacterium]